jgi:hypothetical protein
VYQNNTQITTEEEAVEASLFFLFRSSSFPICRIQLEKRRRETLNHHHHHERIIIIIINNYILGFFAKFDSIIIIIIIIDDKTNTCCYHHHLSPLAFSVRWSIYVEQQQEENNVVDTIESSDEQRNARGVFTSVEDVFAQIVLFTRRVLVDDY